MADMTPLLVPPLNAFRQGSGGRMWPGVRRGQCSEAPGYVVHDLRMLRRLRPRRTIGMVLPAFCKVLQELTISLSQPGPTFSKRGFHGNLICSIPK